MPGETEAIYTQARETLLDALEALEEHRRSVLVVGAQAIYLHTGEGDLAAAPYTTAADLALDPRELPPIQRLSRCSRKRGSSVHLTRPSSARGSEHTMFRSTCSSRKH